MPSSPYLTKSDFKSCFDCRTKLFYRKNGYPSSIDENDYIQFLADGGFMIEKVAKEQFPHGVDLVAELDPLKALARTQVLIAADENAVVFEAAAVSGKYQARIDILRREGKTLHLIEVKSSSLKSNQGKEENDASSPFIGKKGKNKGRPNAKWKPCLLDVAFQAWVLRQAFPDYEVKPWLWVVNKSHLATMDETMDHFTILRDPQNPTARPKVFYGGYLASLRNTGLLTYRDVSVETEILMPEVMTQAGKLAALIGAQGVVARIQEPISIFYKECRTCEYRFKGLTAPKQHGFAECWGALAPAQPHILDLYRVTQIGSEEIPDPVPELLDLGHASLLDLEIGQLGEEGKAWQCRRQIQWSHSANGGQEYLSPELGKVLRAHQAKPGWPLFFLDFEACNVALPHHAGLRPYDRVAFQWSCHTLDQQGQLTHAEWLNTGRDFPNFAFAQSLRRQLGDTGTIYIWSHYEISTLNRVLIQMTEWVQRDASEAVRVSALSSRQELDALADWINQLLGPKNEDGKHHDSPRIRDLHKLAVEYYFHPEMLGRTSIKVVLPAVWRHDAELRKHPWFSGYEKTDASGQLVDPYKTLQPLPLGDEDEDDDEAVMEGTGAIRVYQDLIFNQDSDPQYCANREQLLKQYCKLDTLAMVMIWKHWITPREGLE